MHHGVDKYKAIECGSPREISRAKAMQTSTRGRPTDINLMTLSRGSSSSRWLSLFIAGPSCRRASDSMALAAALAMDMLDTCWAVKRRLKLFSPTFLSQTEGNVVFASALSEFCHGVPLAILSHSFSIHSLLTTQRVGKNPIGIAFWVN